MLTAMNVSIGAVAAGIAARDNPPQDRFIAALEEHYAAALPEMNDPALPSRDLAGESLPALAIRLDRMLQDAYGPAALTNVTVSIPRLRMPLRPARTLSPPVSSRRPACRWLPSASCDSVR